MSSRGLFITVEGGEGVGKSTNISFMESALRGKGVELLVTREPGGSQLGEAIRGLLLDNHEEAMQPLAELLLVFAARAQHISTRIEPALAAGKWVLCDRFTDATYAYQCGGRGLDRAAVTALETLVQGELRPDCTLLLDAPVDTGMARAAQRGTPDRFEQENMAFFERVRATYLELAENSSGRYRIIDASRPLVEVQHQLSAVCDELIACWGVRHPRS
jgi:dTMP kinase